MTHPPGLAARMEERLREGSAHTLELAREILGLSGHAGAASAAVFALLGDDARFRVDAGGVWTFFTNSNEGSRLRIGSTLVVDNDGIHAMTEVAGTIALAAGVHAIRIEFFERTGAAGLIASWQGPGVAKEVIPADAFRRGGVDPAADIDNNGAVDGADLARVLSSWGTTDPAADLTRDGTVDGADLAELLNFWGN